MCSERDTSTTKKGTVNHNPEKPCHFSIIINAIVLSIKENVSIYFVNEDFTLQLIFLRFVFMVSNATFNNISVISWRSVLLVEESVVPGENHLPCPKSLTNFIT
jgi:hypothetical protein